MNTLTLMVGVSGSGKSTYAKTLAKHIRNIEYISRDEIRFKMLEEEGETQYFGVEQKVFKEFVSRIDKALLEGKHVLADATHLTPSSRLKLLKSLEVKPNILQAIVMDTPLEECLKRNRERTGLALVPENVIHSMYECLKPPKHKEGKYTYNIIMIKKDNEMLEIKHVEERKA